MKIFLSDQSQKLGFHLENLKKRPVMPYDLAVMREKVSEISIATEKKLHELDLDFLFDYNIFPGNIMSHLAQWKAENREMQQGDTIVQQVYLPPYRPLSQKIIFGVRVKELFNEPNRRGFSYETLTGHIEQGLSAFIFEQRADKIYFKIKTNSGVANIFAKLTAAFIARPYQAFCTRKALANVKRTIEN